MLDAKILKEHEILSSIIHPDHCIVVVGANESMGPHVNPQMANVDPSAAYCGHLVAKGKGRVIIVDPQMVRRDELEVYADRYGPIMKKLEKLQEIAEAGNGAARHYRNSVQFFKKKYPDILLRNPKIQPGTAIQSGLKTNSANVWLCRGTHNWVAGSTPNEPRQTTYRTMIEEAMRVLKT